MKTIKELEAELDCQYPKADERTKGYYLALKDVKELIIKKIKFHKEVEKQSGISYSDEINELNELIKEIEG